MLFAEYERDKREREREKEKGKQKQEKKRWRKERNRAFFCHATKSITALYIFLIGVENYPNVNGLEKKVISIKHY